MKRTETDFPTIERKSLMAILETSSAGIVVVENPDGNISYANQKAIAMLGKEIISSHQHKTSAKETVKSDENLFQLIEHHVMRSLKTGETITGEEITFHGSDGKMSTLSVTLTPVFTASGEIEEVVTVLEDITSRKEVEEELRFKSFLLDHVNDAILEVDNSFTIKYWNKGAEKLYGWTAEEAIGRKSQDLIQTKFLHTTREEATAVANTFGENEADMLQKNKDDSDIYVGSKFVSVKDKNGNITDYIGVNRDITEKFKIQTSLKESEEKFSKVFRYNPAPMVISSPGGRMIDANESFLNMMGYSREEIFEETFIATKFFYDPERRKELIAQLLESGILQNVEVKAMDKSGKIRNLLMSSELIEIGSQKLLISTMVDLTEKNEAESLLKESEEKFTKIFRDNPAPILITSFDGRIIDANESCLKSMGYSREEISNGSILSYQFYYDPKEREELIRKIRENGSIHNVEFKAVDRYGTKKHYLMSTEIININYEKYLISTMLDVSAKTEAEESLRESEEKFSKVFHNNPAAIIINTIEEGRVIDANEKASEILGYSRKELLDKKFSMKKIYSKPTDRNRFIKQLKNKGSIRDFEILGKDKYGNHKNFLISAIIQKINDEDCIIGSILDITIRRQSQEALRKNKAILDAALSSMTDALMITDKNGQLLVINQGFADFYKCRNIEDCSLKVDEYPGVFEMFSPEGTPVPFKSWAFNRALKGERSAMEEYLIKRKDTGQEWVGSFSFSPVKDLKGKITGAVVVSRDITEKIKIEQELKESREKLQKAHDNLEIKVEERTALLKNTLTKLDTERDRLTNVLNMIPAYVAVLNKSHLLVFGNKAYEKEFGPADENKGYDFHQREHNCEECSIDLVFQTKQPKYWEWKAPNDKIYEVYDFPFQDSEGNELVLEMGLDITEKKNVEMIVLKKVLETEEKGKRKFASDLHDDLGPTLSAAKLQLSLLESEITDGSQRETLMFCNSLINDSIQKMRTIANSILPHVLESCGLEAAVGTFLAKVTNDSPLSFEVRSNLKSFRFDKETELHLYRIITELITNTIKHSGGDKINLSMNIKDTQFEMVYSDNGSGYAFTLDPKKFSGVGLQNIRNRVDIINGTLEPIKRGGKTVVRIRRSADSTDFTDFTD